MKISSYFFARLFLGCLLWGGWIGSYSFADEISIAGAASLKEDTQGYTLQAWANYSWFNLFVHTDFERVTWGVMGKPGPFSVGLGNLQKPGALSRLNRPETTGYTSALSPPALTVVGRGATVSHIVPSDPILAATVQYRPPLKGSKVEFFINGDKIINGDISVPLTFGATTLRLGAGISSYNLASKESTSWYVDTPQFAEDRYTSFLFEASVRYRYGKARKYGQWFLPVVVTGYGAAGIAETPFGGFDPWFRGDAGLTAGLMSVKAKFYHAPYDFYTPDNRLAPHRTRFAVNPVVNIPVSRKHGIILAAGVSLSGDTSTDLYTARFALKASTGFIAATVTSGLDNWYLSGDDLGPSKTSAIPVQVTAQGIFPYIKATVTGKGKWYVDASMDEKKTEYTLGVSAVPRLKGLVFAPAIPAGTARFYLTTWPDGRKKKSGTFGFKWQGRLKMVKWAARLDFEW
jgi:hypothetical protein